MMINKIITETINNYIDNIIKEYHDQPRLPFEEFGYGHAYMDEFIDWIQYSSQKGQLPKPTITWEEGVKKGCKEYYEKAKEDNYYMAKPLAVIEREVEKHGIIKYPQFDENGNLYVERVLEVKSPSLNNHAPLLYHSLIQLYEDNVGGCWCWKPNEAQAYCNDGSGVKIKLCGYMFLDDIYWAELIRKATNIMKHEYEIRTYPRGRIMITKIEFSDSEENYVVDIKGFDGPRILRQTYFGNSSSFQGDYAKIGLQGIGYDKQYIDRQGNEYTKKELMDRNIPIFNKVFDYKEGFAAVEMDGGFNYINKNGELLWKGEWFDTVDDFSHGVARVEVGGRYNMINSNGELLWKDEEWLDDISNFSEGFAIVSLDDKGFNYINKNGELLWKGKWFDVANDFINGHGKVEDNNWRKNYINEKGQLVSEIWFDYAAYCFSEGFAVVSFDDKGYNYLSENGELLWKGEKWFDSAYDFINGVGQVRIDDETYFINKKGQLMKS